MSKFTAIEKIDYLTLIPNIIKKRIKRELTEVYALYDHIIIETNIYNKLVITLKRNQNSYLFIIPDYYPFRNPTVEINGRSQNYFFDLKSNRFRTILKHKTGMDCLCCSSSLCPSNWMPGITLDQIVRELENYKATKYNIFITIISDKIKETYLIKDIDLESWLYRPILKYIV